MDFKELIQIGDQYAEISFVYKGLLEGGMMAWLDAQEIKTWWRAENTVIEPYPGGMFYVTWADKSDSSLHAICGAMEVIDTENNEIGISKILYVSSAGKIGPTHLKIRFEKLDAAHTRLTLRLGHPHRGRLNKLYNDLVYASWPQTFALLKKYLEAPVPSLTTEKKS